MAVGNSPVHISYAQLGAGQSCVAELEYYYWDEPPAEEISFRFRVLDFAREAIVFNGTNTITLS